MPGTWPPEPALLVSVAWQFNSAAQEATQLAAMQAVLETVIESAQLPAARSHTPRPPSTAAENNPKAKPASSNKHPFAGALEQVAAARASAQALSESGKGVSDQLLVAHVHGQVGARSCFLWHWE